MRAVQPEVTVVIPTRDRLALLMRSLGAALGQRGVSCEVIVVDDGDGAAAAAVSRLCRPDVRGLVNPGPHGVSNARNHGLAAARGRFVAFLDDDDLWAPTKLAAQLAVLERTGAAWACAGCVLIDPAERLVGCAAAPGPLVTAEAVLAANAVPGGGSGVVADAALVRRLGGFDPALSLYEDWDLWVRLALEGPGAYADGPLVAYRVWRSASTAVSRLEAAWRSVVERYAVEAQARGVHAEAADLYGYLAYRALCAGEGRRAGAAYLRLARAGGGWRAGMASVAAWAAAPALVALAERRGGRSVPTQWRREAEAWLRAVRPADEGPPDGGADPRRG